MNAGCRALQDSEVFALYEIADNEYRCLISIGIRTGFRISEILSIQWIQVLNPDNSIRETVEVKKRYVKGATATRRVPLHDETKLFLKNYYESLDGLNKSHHTKLFKNHATTYHRGFKKLIRRIGIKEDAGTIAFHSFRKHFAAGMYQKLDKDIFALQKVMGHLSLSSTAHYVGVDEEKINNAFKK